MNKIACVTKYSPKSVIESLNKLYPDKTIFYKWHNTLLVIESDLTAIQLVHTMFFETVLDVTKINN